MPLSINAAQCLVQVHRYVKRGRDDNQLPCAIRRAKQTGSTKRAWLVALMARRSTKIAAIALANKIARIAWAIMVRGTRYREPIQQAA